MVPIVVLNGTATSGSSGTSVNFEIDNPAPVIKSFAPASFSAGASSTMVSVVGTGFVPATVINVNGSSRSTTFVSSTQVNILLTVADIATATALNLTAVNSAPGGGTSAAASLPVNNPVPTLIGITPATIAAGTTTSTPITITGTNFVNGSSVLVGTNAHAATVVSPTQITSVLSAADVATAGKLNIAVTNPAPGGGNSNVGNITVVTPTPTPVLTSLAPSTIVVGSGNTTVTVYSSNLTNSCQVLWNSTVLPFALFSSASYQNGAYVYSQYAIASVPASLIASLGTASITANCPTALSPVSNALTVTVANPPVPTLSSVLPAVGPIGTDQKISVTGSDFTTKSTVSYNGILLSTTFVSSTSLSATLPASSNVLPGIGSFTVNTPAPGGGTSGPAAFTAYVPVANNDMIYNPVNGLFYASVPSSAGAPYGNTIVSIDPATGAFGKPIAVGSEPDRLAVTSDGKYLWVGLDGANAVRKVDLTSGTPGLQFAIPQQSPNSVGNSSAYALAALPGATDSVLVSSSDFPNYFAIYDSGVVRGSTISGYYTQPYAILTDGSKNEVYASGSNGYQTFNYTSSGLTLRSTASTGISVPSGGDMQIAGGKLYPSNGKVYDAESGALQGTLYLTGNTVANGSTFADAALSKIFVLDIPSNYVFSGSYQVQVFNATDYTSSTAIPISVSTSVYSSPSRLTRWGSNGLAFRNTDGLYSFRSNLVKDLSGVSADLGVTITTSGTTTSAPVVFTLTVTNNGSSSSTNAVLAGFLPTNGLLRSVTSTMGSCSSVSTLSCDFGSLANGASATIVVTIQPLTAGNLTLGAQVVGSENDTVASNNTASATVAVTGADYNTSPTLTSLSPAAFKAGSPDTVMTINGAGFNSGSTVSLGTTTLMATLVSSTQMTAIVPTASLASMGWAAVTVTNAAPGGGTSAPAPLTVFNVLSAGLNDMIYEPFSRKIFASVGSGSASLTGNSIVSLTPESGSFGTPANVGSQPTRLALTGDGQYLYTTLSGANSIARFNVATNATEFTFSPTLPTNYFSSSVGLADVAVQPGSDTVLAVNYGSYSGVGLVDVDVANRRGTLRGGTTATNYSSSSSASTTHFRDANTLLLYDGSLEQYGVPAAGISSSTAHTGSYLQPFGSFMLSGKYAYSDDGGLADVSGGVPVQIGAFRSSVNSYLYNQKVAGDAGLNRAFFAAYTGVTSYSSSIDGILGFDQNTLLPTTVLPLGLVATEGTSNYTVNDLIRWGQDGLAMLTSTGHVYLLRGAAVVPGLLTSNTAATLTGIATSTVAHGASNTVLTLTGTNFLPGVAVNWNGSYRTTTIVDATHVTVAIPASDLTIAGSATLTAVNPGANSSPGLTFTIN